MLTAAVVSICVIFSVRAAAYASPLCGLYQHGAAKKKSRQSAPVGETVPTLFLSLFSGVLQYSADKLLCPIIAAVGILRNPHAQFGKRGIQDVRPVTLGIHPTGHDLLGRGLPHGDIFTCRAIADAELLHHIERRAVCRGGMVKIAEICHIFGFQRCCFI